VGAPGYVTGLPPWDAARAAVYRGAAFQANRNYLAGYPTRYAIVQLATISTECMRCTARDRRVHSDFQA